MGRTADKTRTAFCSSTEPKTPQPPHLPNHFAVWNPHSRQTCCNAGFAMLPTLAEGSDIAGGGPGRYGARPDARGPLHHRLSRPGGIRNYRPVSRLLRRELRRARGGRRFADVQLLAGAVRLRADLGEDL